MFDQFFDAIMAHAREEYPRESCGAITDEGYQRLNNISADPDHTFECTEQITPMLEAGTLEALVHSHPDGPYAPSAWDMQQQMAMAVPWGLTSCTHDAASPPFFWSDDFDPPELLGRPFRYGPSGTDGRGDCAALVRDWYRINRNVRLKEFPRENLWWLKPGVSYRKNLLATGFALADRNAPEEGDVFLAQLRSTAPNHSGIYMGGGLVLHHLQDRFSRIDPLVPWQRFVTDWFRYAG